MAAENTNILQGEACESDDEPCLVDKRDKAPHEQLGGCVVEGEASESDSEDIEKPGKDQGIGVQEIDVPLEVSEKTASVSREMSEGRKPKEVKTSKPSKYSLLESKLREKNSLLRTHIENFTKNIFLTPEKDVQMLLGHMVKSKSTLQDVSHNLRMATNDLFHLEDKLDIVITCKILSDLKLPV